MWWLHRRQIYAIFPSKSQSHTTIGVPFIVRNVFFSTQKSNCDERMLEDIKISFFYLRPCQLESYKVGVTFFFCLNVSFSTQQATKTNAYIERRGCWKTSLSDLCGLDSPSPELILVPSALFLASVLSTTHNVKFWLFCRKSPQRPMLIL